MKVRIGLKNLETGTLEGGQLFTAHSLVVSGRQYLQETGQWNHVAVDAFGNELPHYFSEEPMYTVRHFKGGWSAMLWRDTPKKAVRAFLDARDKQGYALEPLVGKRGGRQWCIVDHRGNLYQDGKNRFWTAPEKAGMFALRRTWAGDDYLFANTKGETWMKSLNAVYRFVSFNSFPRKGVTVLESLGNGEWKERPEIDPFM